jgi:hypothetical protein
LDEEGEAGRTLREGKDGIEITLITLDEASCMETAAINPGFFFHINLMNHSGFNDYVLTLAASTPSIPLIKE